uniref:CARD- and ANK-containing Inflammasome Adaptor Protein n=1 Tax=Seriola lalandi dorsalis TaxID=1841481 RepID=A0A3B4W9U3_SERLL
VNGLFAQDGLTPLHLASQQGHADAVIQLLRDKADPGVKDRNAWRKTVLHVAAEKGHDSVAVLLLEAGAKINTTDHSKDTPLPP